MPICQCDLFIYIYVFFERDAHLEILAFVLEKMMVFKVIDEFVIFSLDIIGSLMQISNPLQRTKETWIKCHLPLSAAYRDSFLTLGLQGAVGNDGTSSPSPMLILHGDRDRSVPLEMLDRKKLDLRTWSCSRYLHRPTRATIMEKLGGGVTYFLEIFSPIWGRSPF